MISEEIGINVKVREKYARMHNRAVERGFDFKANGMFYFSIAFLSNLHFSIIPQELICVLDNRPFQIEGSSRNI